MKRISERTQKRAGTNRWRTVLFLVCILSVVGSAQKRSGSDVYYASNDRSMQGGLSSVPITPHPGFSAVSGLGCVSLSWVNAAEPNNCGFEIERRSMESKQWTAVSFVPATNSGKEYAYTDTRVSAGSYIYRMKQINRDGTFQYYGVQEVTVTIPTILSLRANSSAPSNVHAAVEYTVAKNENVTLKVYNVLGQEVATLVNGEQHPGVVYYVAVDTSKYVAGMYYYTLQTKDQTLMQRIFVAK